MAGRADADGAAKLATEALTSWPQAKPSRDAAGEPAERAAGDKAAGRPAPKAELKAGAMQSKPVVPANENVTAKTGGPTPPAKKPASRRAALKQIHGQGTLQGFFSKV